MSEDVVLCLNLNVLAQKSVLRAIFEFGKGMHSQCENGGLMKLIGTSQSICESQIRL